VPFRANFCPQNPEYSFWINSIFDEQGVAVLTVNLGTGVGYSVLEMVKAFEKASGRTVNYQIVERREGDTAECYADPAYAKEVLGWEAELGLDEMCGDSWRYINQ